MDIGQYLLRLVPLVLAAVLVFCSVGQILVIKPGYVRRGILLFSCFFLVGMVIFIGDIVNLPPTLIFFLTCIMICCEGSVLQKLTIGLMFGSTAFAANAILDNVYINEFLPITTLRLLFWIILYIFLRHFTPERNYEISPTLWRLLLFLTSIPFGIVVTIVLLGGSEEQLEVNLHITYYILLGLSLIAFIGLLWTILVLVKQKELENQSKLAEINQKYYKSLEQQQFQIRQLKHDMSNHLQMLYSLPEAKKNDYIEQLLNTSGVTKAVRYCGEPTINAILKNKSSIAEESQTQLYIKADVAAPLPFANVDICAIFANALDNAIEYCQKLPIEKRLIHLETYVRKGLFVFRIMNPCEEEEIKSLPKTSKKDRQNHGIGLRSIRETIKRYSGNMEIRISDGKFILFIYIPL
ncbi:MAG: sensor histidine kinase [Suipraeoptans sp.]